MTADMARLIALVLVGIAAGLVHAGIVATWREECE